MPHPQICHWSFQSNGMELFSRWNETDNKHIERIFIGILLLIFLMMTADG